VFHIARVAPLCGAYGETQVCVSHRLHSCSLWRNTGCANKARGKQASLSMFIADAERDLAKYESARRKEQLAQRAQHFGQSR
jgi:hypothetical protein